MKKSYMYAAAVAYMTVAVSLPAWAANANLGVTSAIPALTGILDIDENNLTCNNMYDTAQDTIFHFGSGLSGGEGGASFGTSGTITEVKEYQDSISASITEKKEEVISGSTSGGNSGGNSAAATNPGNSKGEGAEKPSSINPDDTEKKEETPTVEYHFGQIYEDGERIDFDDKYFTPDGKINPDTTPGSILDVTANSDGSMSITVIGQDGKDYTVSWTEYFKLMITSEVKDADGNRLTLTSTFNRTGDIRYKDYHLYYLWRMCNLTNPKSRYSGNLREVARTNANKAEVQPDVWGTYKATSTKYFRRVYEERIEWEDSEGETHHKWVKVGEEVLTDPAGQYEADVPLICRGCPVPTICLNGGCDCTTKLNTICDYDHAPSYDVEVWSILEQ